MLRNILIWGLIAASLFALFNSNLSISSSNVSEVDYSIFVTKVNQGEVSEVVIDGQRIQGRYLDGSQFFTTRPPIEDTRLMDDLLRNNVLVRGSQPEQQSLWRQLLVASFPILLLLGVFMFTMRNMQSSLGGRGGPMSFGRSKAKLMSESKVKVSFNDVAGIDEARDEVQEIVDFLQDGEKFIKLGGRVPRGVLLAGPPGTGKTLLAKAIAGEAGVPFFSISGSEFVEMFVGVGASRVRDMFEQARKKSPCIVFIDEIDAVGRHRGAGLGGGHDEREQTLNQLLVEMDGFDEQENVIIIAATNRPDVLDPALLRPGRFDRQVVVPLPDVRGREHILKVHLAKANIDKQNVDASVLARGTPGFSGADLANLVNEAALLAARTNKRKIGMHELEKAKDRVMMGSERRSMVMTLEEKKMTAYHEAGHAIVGRLVPDHDPVYKVTIIPRGRALGVTMFLPEKDKYSQSKRALLSQVSTLYGGRIAEELIFGSDMVSTGASNDIERATQIARNMVTRWGLSEKLGPIKYDESGDEVFLGRSMAAKHQNMANETAKLIDAEAKEIISSCYQVATELLQDNLSKLHAMAEALIEYETIDSEQIDAIMAGRKPEPPKEPPTTTRRRRSAKSSSAGSAKKSTGVKAPRPVPLDSQNPA